MTIDTAQGELMDTLPASSSAARAANADSLSVLRVPVTDLSMEDALAWFEQLLTRQPRAKSHAVYFVNAHTLNVACDDPDYLQVLR